MKIEDFRPIRSQDSALIKIDWLLTQESDWIIWTNQKITLIIFWLVKNGKDWNPAISLVKRIFLLPDHHLVQDNKRATNPDTSHQELRVATRSAATLPLMSHTHSEKALRLKILPGQQQLPLFLLLSPPPPPPPPTHTHTHTLRATLLHFSTVKIADNLGLDWPWTSLSFLIPKLICLHCGGVHWYCETVLGLFQCCSRTVSQSIHQCKWRTHSQWNGASTVVVLNLN